MSELLSPAGNMDCLRAAVTAGGLPSFSARAGADNFNEQQLRAAKRLCCENGVKLYVTLNTLMFDRETDKLCDALKLLADVHADGVIVQDLGVARLARALIPELALHASTQMAVYSLNGAKALERLGFKRVVLARELSLSEIRQITRHTALETEVFVHGALCMCYSGHCYFSSVVGQNSGNRGRCAQPCRLPYNGGYPLSLKDVNALEHIHALTEAGVTSFKIEGRLKAKEYVAAVTEAYRTVLDGGTADDAVHKKLADIFSRDGFTDGYLTGKTGSAMFGVKKPTAFADYKAATHGLADKKPYKRFALHLTLKAQIGQPSCWELTDGTRTVTVFGAPAQRAEQKGLTDSSLFEKFNKLTDTPFILKSVRLEGDNIFLPVSEINAARRRAIDALMQSGGHQPFSFTNKPPALPQTETQSVRHSELLFYRAEALPQADLSRYQRVWLSAQDIDAYTGANRGVWIDHFTPDEELESILTRCRGKTDSVLVGNIGHIAPALAKGYSVHGDYSLNITNSHALYEYSRLGLSSVCLSFELSAPQLRDIEKYLPASVICYGRLPLMRFKNCAVRQCGKCIRQQGFSKLKDRKGAEFLLACCPDCGNILFNSVPLSLHGLHLPVQTGRFDFTDEKPEEVLAVLNAFETGVCPTEHFTRGLFNRGIR